MFSFFFIFLVTVTILVCLTTDAAYGHLSPDNKKLAAIQEWNDQQNAVKVLFSYSPEKPLLYTPTDLKFSIQDLKTGNHLEDLVMNSTIIKDDKIFFKFNGVTIKNGDLSLKAQFPEDGNYQIISQVRSKDNVAIALTSFNIFVPLQPFGKFDADSLTSTLIPAGLVAISLLGLVAVIMFVSKKKNSKRKPAEEKDGE
jgi:hypothetical protein